MGSSSSTEIKITYKYPSRGLNTNSDDLEQFLKGYIAAVTDRSYCKSLPNDIITLLILFIDRDICLPHVIMQMNKKQLLSKLKDLADCKIKFRAIGHVKLLQDRMRYGYSPATPEWQDGPLMRLSTGNTPPPTILDNIWDGAIGAKDMAVKNVIEPAKAAIEYVQNIPSSIRRTYRSHQYIIFEYGKKFPEKMDDFEYDRYVKIEFRSDGYRLSMGNTMEYWDVCEDEYEGSRWYTFGVECKENVQALKEIIEDHYEIYNILTNNHAHFAEKILAVMKCSTEDVIRHPQHTAM